MNGDRATHWPRGSVVQGCHNGRRARREQLVGSARRVRYRFSPHECRRDSCDVAGTQQVSAEEGTSRCLVTGGDTHPCAFYRTLEADDPSFMSARKAVYNIVYDRSRTRVWVFRGIPYNTIDVQGSNSSPYNTDWRMSMTVRHLTSRARSRHKRVWQAVVSVYGRG